MDRERGKIKIIDMKGESNEGRKGGDWKMGRQKQRKEKGS